MTSPEIVQLADNHAAATIGGCIFGGLFLCGILIGEGLEKVARAIDRASDTLILKRKG